MAAVEHREATPARRWHLLEAPDVLAALETTPEGLDADEARARLEHYGPNRLAEERETPWWALALHQFRDPLIYVLVVAGLVTLALRDYTDTAVIFAVVFINAIIGFIQEHRAQQAVRALARLASPKAVVVREGAPVVVDGDVLVPGDVVALSSGARVPADLRLFLVQNLELDESALTGESVPVSKTTDALEGETLVAGDQVNMAFAGTVATRGRGRGVVVRTGAATELGQIATTVREVGQVATPLQRKMERFARQVALVVLGLSAVVAVVGALRALAAEEIFLTAVALAVSVIPEGLPIVLTVTLAIGVRRMARRRAIIRSLPAVETLGSTTVIGSDKTGTLTKNEMTVRRIRAGERDYRVTGEGYAIEGAVVPEADGAPGARPSGDEALRRCLLGAALANEADPVSVLAGRPVGDPTELALHVVAAKAGIDPVGARHDHPERDLLPFEPERRFMASLNDGPDGRAIYVKGAPEAVLERCDRRLGADGERPIDPDAVLSAAADFAAEGLRVLAVAYRPTAAERIDERELASGFVFAGLLGMEDPVRPEAVAAVAAAHDAGIRVLMLTGDHADTARVIGRQLGLKDEPGAVEGRWLEGIADAELDRLLEDVDVYARVGPEHKFRIVDRLRERGDTVAVTGDGVNDAPALRAAHIGIAMGVTGTDVAREAADMILADDNFATITAAVEEGRVVFGNVRKVTFFLLSTAVGEALTILAALFAGWPLPFIAAQILWINLVTNGLQDVALAFEKGEPGLLEAKPRPPHENIVTLRLLERLGGVGLVLAAGTLGVFLWTLGRTDDLEAARTVAMTQMVVFQFFHVFNSRSLDRSILGIPPFSNRFLFISLVAAAAAHLTVIYTAPLQAVFSTVPLDASQWLVITLVGTTVIAGAELDKWRNRRRGRPLG